MNLVDTSGWIAYFFGGPNAAFFSPAIENTRKLVVSTVCMYEVFKKVCAAAGEKQALETVAQMKQGRVVPVSEEIALRAAQLSLRHRIPMADSIIYATALREKATVWTQDEDFKNLPNVRFKPPTGRKKSTM